MLTRVQKDGAFAAASLDAELARGGLDPRDAALATELVYGVLRSRGYLVQRLEGQARTGKLVDHPEALSHLLIGAYSLLFSRIPPHAAVSECVSAVKAVMGQGPAKFANALLRGLLREHERAGPVQLDLVAWVSTPGWLQRALIESLGEEQARAYVAAGPIPPPVGLAVLDPAARPELVATLAARGLAPRLSALSPHGILLDKMGDVREAPGYERTFIQQEEGAQVAALALGARPGERVLDACAGRGNKSLLLAALVGEQGAVTACDKYPRKLESLVARSSAPITVRAIDWSLGTGSLDGAAGGASRQSFDRILVDAPCSGSGTLRRRPDILSHRSEAALGELAQTQLAVVRNAATLARPGGTLLYCVCSVLAAEAEAITAALVTLELPGLRLVPSPFPVPPFPEAAGRSEAKLLPHVHGTDGYYLAHFTVTPA